MLNHMGHNEKPVANNGSRCTTSNFKNQTI